MYGSTFGARLLATSLFIFLSLTIVSASSDFFFPRLSLESGSLMGIAIVNPTGEDAPVFLTALGENGQVLAAEGFNNPVNVMVPGNTQYARITLDIFGSGLDPSTIAWVRATSAVTGLTGFFLFLNSTVSEFDGADLPTPASNLAFNDIRITDGASTEINLVNPSPATATVNIRLSGLPETERALLLAGGGVSRFDVAEFFELSEVQAQGIDPDAHYLEIDAGSPIIGFQVLRPDSEGDVLGLNSSSRDQELSELFFPQLAVLDPFETRLSLSNYGDETVLVTVRAHRPDGTLYGPPDLLENPVVRAIEAGAAAQFDVAELFGFQGTETLEGWIAVTASEPSINGSISYAIPASSSRAAVASLAQGTTRAIFSHLATAQNFFTGIAALNAGALAANVRIVALTPSGKVLGSFTTLLQPGQRISRLVSDIIPAAAGQAGGFVWVASDVPVFLTSLFGNLVSRVLANIPPQPAPPGFRPDLNIPQLRVMPSLAVLQPDGQQAFSASGGNVGSWGVNGNPGGNDLTGTVSPGGLYTAPDPAPLDLPVTVSAANESQSAGAAVDVLDSQVVISNLGQLQSVAYLSGQQRVFAAELTVGGAGSEGSAPATTSTSRILDVSTGTPQLITELVNEEVPDMLAFTASDQSEYLLLAAPSSGRVLRLDPDSGTAVQVVQGLNNPSALAFDPDTGNLLVATDSGIFPYLAAVLEQGLAAAGAEQAPALFFPGVQSDAIAVDRCTGDLYLSEAAQGQVVRLLKRNGEREIVANGLGFPGSILPIYRTGVSCPESLHLLVVQRSTSQITLIVPALDLVQPWVNIPGVVDLAYISDTGQPAGPAGVQSAVLSADIPGVAGQLSAVLLPDLYRPEPLNVDPTGNCFAQVTVADFNLENAIRNAVNQVLADPLGPSQQIPCDIAGNLESLVANQVGIASLEGIQQLARLQRLDLRLNSLSDLSALQGLNDLVFLDVSSNGVNTSTFPELPSLRTLDLSNGEHLNAALNPLANLPSLIDLRIGFNQVDDLTPISDLFNLRRLDASENRINDVSPLAGLSGLTDLSLSANQVDNLDPLADLFALERLNLAENAFPDVNALAGLERLSFLDLRNNAISNITPLVNNPGLGPGDFVFLEGNPLDTADCLSINQLIARGVTVTQDVICPPVN